eukprot:3419829-Pleurochrysis_carterae.AAC.2
MRVARGSVQSDRLGGASSATAPRVLDVERRGGRGAHPTWLQTPGLGAWWPLENGRSTSARTLPSQNLSLAPMIVLTARDGRLYSYEAKVIKERNNIAIF